MPISKQICKQQSHIKGKLLNTEKPTKRSTAAQQMLKQWQIRNYCLHCRRQKLKLHYLFCACTNQQVRSPSQQNTSFQKMNYQTAEISVNNSHVKNCVNARASLVTCTLKVWVCTIHLNFNFTIKFCFNAYITQCTLYEFVTT